MKMAQKVGCDKRDMKINLDKQNIDDIIRTSDSVIHSYCHAIIIYQDY